MSDSVQVSEETFDALYAFTKATADLSETFAAALVKAGMDSEQAVAVVQAIFQGYVQLAFTVPINITVDSLREDDEPFADAKVRIVTPFEATFNAVRQQVVSRIFLESLFGEGGIGALSGVDVEVAV